MEPKKGQKKVNVSWDEINNMSHKILQQIKKSGKVYKNIYAVPRGGLILGVFLSNHIGIPMIHNTILIEENTLIIDDISDSGNTLNQLSYAFYTNTGTNKTHMDTAILYERLGTMWEGDYVGQKINEVSWLIFPWEEQK